MNQDKIIIGVEESLEEVKQKRYKRARNKIFILLILAFILLVIYLFSPLSRIRRVVIVNNNYYKDSEVIKAANLKLNSLLILVNKEKIKNNLIDKLAIIKDIELDKKFDGSVELKLINRRIVGYFFVEEGIRLISDSGYLFLDDDHLNLMSNWPYFNSISHQQLEQIVPHILQLSDNLISMISEVKYYNETYEKDMLVLYMNDGNKVYISINDLELLKNYHNIVKNLKKQRMCIRFDSLTNTAYSSDCNSKEVAND